MSFDHRAAASPVRRLLVALVAAVCRRPRLVLLVALVLCLASAVAAGTRLKYHTSRNDLISARKDCQQRWQKYLAEFGDDDDIVVVVQGADKERMQAALEAVAARLRQRPDLFDRLFYKVDLRPLRNRALLLAPYEQVEAIHRDYLADMKRLLDFGPVSWHALGLHPMIQEARQRLAAIRPDQPLSASDERFLRQLAPIARVAADTLRDPMRYANPWGGMPGTATDQQSMLDEPHYFFSGDGVLAFLLVRPVKQAGSFTAALESVSAARGILDEVKAEFAGLRMGLTGLPVLETDEMVAAERDTRWASYLAVVGVSLLFLVVYRSVAYPALTVLTLLVGTAWAFGWLTLTVGHLNILSATFAVMLIGMGDYGVLWVMRYEHARREGMPVRDALLHTTTHVAVGNLTAASTLALAFFAAIFADFKAVAELGWIAGCGVLLCAFACFTVLPALLMVFDRRLELSPVQAEILNFQAARAAVDTWLPWVRRHAGAVLAAGLLVAAAVGSGALRVHYDHNLLHLQAEGLDSVRWERTLIEHTAGASWHTLSYTASREEAQALTARYKQLPEVSQVVEVASLVPPDQARKLPLVAAIHQQLDRLPKRGVPIRHPPPDLDELRQDLANLVARLGEVAGAGALLADLHAGMAALDRVVADAPAGEATRRLVRLDERLAGDLAEGLHRLHDVSTPAAIRVEELPPALRERYIGKGDTWLLRVFAKHDLWDFEPLEDFTKKIRSIDPEATGKPFGTVEGLKAMKNGLTRAGVYAFCVIVLVLWLDFRGPGRTLLAILPLLLGVLLSLGVLGLCGWPLNPANMIAFPLILGVGVDNGVHVLHDYLIRRREGRPGISAAIGRGVLVKALTTMIGFGTLMIATERGLVGLGFILTLGVGCSMLSALVLLPAALEVLSRRARTAPAAQEIVPLRRAA
jgi:hopanoid biosynthesis associated RND transporter like protein HpnN